MSDDNYCFKCGLNLGALTATWQPIESAPKDGSLILIGHPNWETCWQGFWDDDNDGWQRFNSKGQGLLHPTFWMPMPEPPVSL